MRVSLNTIKQFTDVDLPLDELRAKINSQLGAIEQIIDLGDKYKDAVIVTVVECEKHPAADRLNVTKIDDGGAVNDIERDENGYVQVVCGAPNVKTGMFAVWLPPRSVVPATYEDKEPFVLGARELRGIMSQGMLAAADELGIGSDHEGILAIDPDEWKPTDVVIEPGVSFASAYGLDDTIIDIENKMFTHRPDLFGQLGVAREISAIIKGLPSSDEISDGDKVPDTRFKNPDWYWMQPQFETVDELKLEIFNDAPNKVSRFMAVGMQNVNVKPSPLWLQCELVRLGGKPINNIVDATNYIMLITAQPTHAYDYDKLRGHKLGVRLATQDESVQLLNGKTYKLNEDDIVIVDGEGAVGLGGVMGGGNSEVSSDTKNIVLECATFDMYTVRKTSMRHGLFTDAVTRFNKGQSRLQNDRVILKLMRMMAELAGAKQASAVYDLPKKQDNFHEDTLSGELYIPPGFISKRLGVTLETQQIGHLLRRANFASYPADDNKDTLCVVAPFWRTDIGQPEDIVEEVGRLYGFDKLPRELPLRSTKPTAINNHRSLKKHVRSMLSRLGANEVLTYSFVHEKILRNSGQKPELAYKLSNALSPDLQHYRLSMTPSLLDKVHMNYKAGYDNFALFELGKAHLKGAMDPDEQDVPREDDRLAFVVARKNAPNGAAYFTALRYAQQLVDPIQHSFVSLSEYATQADTFGDQLVAPYEPARTAVILKDNEVVGVVGEYKAEVRQAFKLPDHSAGFEILLETVSTSMSAYQPLSKFPSVTQDISLKVSNETSFASLENVLQAELNKHTEVVTRLSPTAIYQADSDTSTKTITFRIEVTSHERTLRDKDVTSLLDILAAKAEKIVGAERI